MAVYPPDMLCSSPPDGKTCMDEVVEAIKLPDFDAEACFDLDGFPILI
jgi:hypothetical protein